MTLQCVCGAVFGAWVASGRGEGEEWLESTCEGGSAVEEEEDTTTIPTSNSSSSAMQDLWNPGPVQCRSHPTAIQMNLNRLSSVGEEATTNTNPSSNSSSCAVLIQHC